MNIIELTNAPLVDAPAEGAVLFALNTDGTVNRVKADAVGGTKTAVITQEGSTNTFTCNMTFAEAAAIMKTTKVLDVVIVTGQALVGGEVIGNITADNVVYFGSDGNEGIQIVAGQMTIRWDESGISAAATSTSSLTEEDHE